MAVSYLQSAPLIDIREGVPLAGNINGVNTVFTTPDKFIHIPPTGVSIRIYFNGQRLVVDDDFILGESGGLGTGFDMITLQFAPQVEDKVLADYVVSHL